MVAVRERALSSIHNALPGTTLQTRYTSALFMVKKVCSGRLIWAFTELGKLYLSSSKRKPYVWYIVISFYKTYDTFGPVQITGFCF